MENKKLYKYYFVLVTIIFLIYLLLEYFYFYKNNIQAFILLNAIIMFIFTATANPLIEGFKINKWLGIYISTIVMLMFALTYSFDMQIQYKQENKNVILEDKIKVIEDVTIKNDCLIEDEQHRNKDVTTSVGFLTPSQIEEELNSNFKYIPNLDDHMLNKVYELSSKIRADTIDVKEYSILTYGIIDEKVDGLLHIDEGYSDEMLNANNEVGNLLKQAHEINDRIRINATVNDYISLITIYESAFKLAPCSSISLQLSRPYEEIMLILRIDSMDDCDKIFKYGIKAIDYFLKTLSYKEIRGSSDSDILYRIAKVYHRLGDLPNLKLDLRQELYKISSAYYELSISKLGNNDKYTYHKAYYCAMVNHKLGVISGVDNHFYLNKAMEYYGKSINHNMIIDYTKYKANEYIAEICNRSIAYIDRFGKTEYLKERRMYEDLSKDYKKEANLLCNLLNRN